MILQSEKRFSSDFSLTFSKLSLNILYIKKFVFPFLGDLVVYSLWTK